MTTQTVLDPRLTVRLAIRATGAVMSFTYEIRVRGRLTRTLAAEFEQLDLAATPRAIETVLYGQVEDQAALHGLLRRIESLGLELIEVRRTAVPGPAAASGDDEAVDRDASRSDQDALETPGDGRSPEEGEAR